MIIDTHYHMLDHPYLSANLLDSLAEMCARDALADKPVSFEDARTKIVPKMFDSTGEATVRNLDSWGIDKAALLSIDYGMLHGDGEKSIDDFNRATAAAAKRFPDRLIPFFGMDPRRPDALEAVDRCINDYQMKGLKCHPDSGWFPDDETYLPFWEKINSYKIPIITHVGAMSPPAVSECVHPDRLDKLAQNFPDMTIIAAHMGANWHKELIALAQRHSNILTDISGWQIPARDNYGIFVHILRKVMDGIGSDRVLFGTDAPTISFVSPEENWIDLIKKLPESAPEGYSFTQAEIDAVLGGNAVRILGL